MDIEMEAKKIIMKHTEGYMSATSDYVPENNDDMWSTMISECSYILTENFLSGEYTPMEYNAIRNEIARILGNIFEKIA